MRKSSGEVTHPGMYRCAAALTFLLATSCANQIDASRDAGTTIDASDAGATLFTDAVLTGAAS